MGKFFDFLGEDGESYRVKFEVLEDGNATRRYGVRAEIFQDGVMLEQAEASNRFLTREEALETVAMLCRFRVTPCTLCDII